MAKTKKAKRSSTTNRRQERRFVSRAASNPMLVRGFGALAALVLGAGAYAYFYAKTFAPKLTADEVESIKHSGLSAAEMADRLAVDRWANLPTYLIAAGTVILGIAIWFGTSAEAPVRVGAPGIGLEKGELRRMAWWAVDKISFEVGSLALVVAGKDDAGVAWTFKVSTRSNPDAVAWIVKEALDRIPKRIDIADDTLEKLPRASEQAGEKIELEPLQVVGKRDAVTGKIVSYEPDARVCSQCERVYLKTSVPKKCKCGASLLHLQPADGDGAPASAEAAEQ